MSERSVEDRWSNDEVQTIEDCAGKLAAETCHKREVAPPKMEVAPPSLLMALSLLLLFSDPAHIALNFFHLASEFGSPHGVLLEQVFSSFLRVVRPLNEGPLAGEISKPENEEHTLEVAPPKREVAPPTQENRRDLPSGNEVAPPTNGGGATYTTLNP